VFELGMFAEEVDGEDVETHGHAGAMAGGELREEGGGHAAELALLGGVDLDFGGEEVAGGAGFDLEDDEGVTVPGDEVEVAAEAGGHPAARDDGIAERAEMEEGIVFAELAGEEVRRGGALVAAESAGGLAAAGERAETQEGAALYSEKASEKGGEKAVAEAEGAHGPGDVITILEIGHGGPGYT
jgi:hypothetical protein